MRRKDLLIIVASVIILAFITVLGIYCVVNKEEVKQGITEVIGNKENYYSNGWEKAIVAEIRHDIPIPVGFTYVEGDKKSGLIIKNDNTNEEYMWIPYVEDAGNYMNTELNLKGNTEETKGSILEYNGFFIAIESVEEKYDRYLRENTNDNLKYIELKKVGYEAYKKAYEEQVGEEFNLNKISQEEIEELELRNTSKTEIAQTHLITVEEDALLKKYEETLGKTIFVKDFKALTLSTPSTNTYNKITKKEMIEKAKKYAKIIDEAIIYIANERDEREQNIINKIDKATEGKYIDEFTNPDKLEKMDVSEINDLIEYVYPIAEEVIKENYCETEEEKEEIENRFKEIEEDENVSNEKIKLKDNNEKVEAAIQYAAIINDDEIEEVKERVGFSSNVDYESDEKKFNAIREKLIDEAKSEQSTYNMMFNILDSGYTYAKYYDEDYEDRENDKEGENNPIDPSKWDEKIVTEGNGVPIPQGFVYKTGTVETGVVIEQEGSENLRFIWIPVEDVNKVKEVFKTNAEAAKVEELEINSYAEYKDEEVDEYTALVDSIKMYGGFYISEAELGHDEKGSSINVYRPMTIGDYGEFNRVSNGDYYRNLDDGNKAGLSSKEKDFKLTYESAKSKCKELYDISESVVSHLTYGLEYDATVNYLIEKGVITLEQAFNNSKEIGKYLDTSTQEERAKQGIWDEKYLNGIYGLAGNLSEITQEKYDDKIIVRGGSWDTEGNMQQLASKLPMEKEEIEKDIETIGFRACLYLKTEHEDISNDLKKIKEQEKKDFHDYINNNITNKDAKVIQDICKWVCDKIDEAKSNVALNEIANDGIFASRQIEQVIRGIREYPEGLEGFTYGETNEDCLNIKETAIKEIRELTWKEDRTFINSNGKSVVLNDRRIKVEKDITTVREEYRKKVIEERIDNYKLIDGETNCQSIIDKIKTNAKEKELKWTEDFANIKNRASLYIGLMEMVDEFDQYYPETKEYYEYWKDTKTKYMNKIADSFTWKEAEEAYNEGVKKIGDIINKKTDSLTEIKTEKTQYQKDIETAKANGWIILKTKNVDESKLGLAEWEEETTNFKKGDIRTFQCTMPNGDESYEYVVVFQNDYSDVRMETDADGKECLLFNTVGTAKIRVYCQNGSSITFICNIED